MYTSTHNVNKLFIKFIMMICESSYISVTENGILFQFMNTLLAFLCLAIKQLKESVIN